MVSRKPRKTIAVLLAVTVLTMILTAVPSLACKSPGWGSQNQQETAVSTPPETSSPVYNLYFGQLHSHTSLSDGTGTLDEAYTYARDTAKLDFFAVTDSSEAFDNASQCTLGNGYYSNEWIAGLYAANRYTTSSFAGIYGYEMSLNSGNGHITTFNTLGFENRDKSAYSGTQGLANYYAALKQYPESISQFNHPGSPYGTFQDFALYDAQIDAAISLIEVGSGEGAIGGSQYYRAYSQYDRALDKGWHLAPTNNQDNRKGLWGNANTGRTVVLAKSLNRTDIFDALKNMRVYATEDKNLRIQYTLNDKVMGTRLSQRPDKVRIKAALQEIDNEQIGKVSVIVNGGRVLSSQTVAASQYNLDLTLDNTYSYYYLKIEQADGEIAVTAPVFIDANRAGFAKTYASTNAPKKGVSMKITSEIFNHELVPMSVALLNYTIDGSLVKSVTTQDTIGPLSRTLFSFDYVPPRAGNISVDVRLTVVVNGVQKSYTDTLKLVVTDSQAPPPPTVTTDQDSANKVIKLIDAIHQPANKPHKEDVKEARKAYDKLTNAQKALVTNYQKLVDAEKRLAKLEDNGKHKGKKWHKHKGWKK